MLHVLTTDDFVATLIDYFMFNGVRAEVKSVPESGVSPSEMDCHIAIYKNDDSDKQSTIDILWTNGSISCPVALEMCDEISVSPKVLGALLQEMNIKIKSCSLGCF